MKNRSEATVSEEQVLHNELSFEINQELIHLMKRIVEIQRVNQQLKEVIEEVKRVLRCNNIEVLKYYDEPSETGSYEIVTVDLLQILDKVKDSDD